MEIYRSLGAHLKQKLGLFLNNLCIHVLGKISLKMIRIFLPLKYSDNKLV